jgi:hypothetical protein
MREAEPDLRAVAERFRKFSREECRGYCRFYEDLSARIADAPDVLTLAAHHRPGHPWANLLFAAVRYLLLRGAKHPLRGAYERAAREGTTSEGASAWEDFRAFCREHAEAIAALVATRRVQTNEVGRCVFLRAGLLAGLGAETSRPIALVDVGSSAGLNLRLDRYGYRYRSASGAETFAGPRDATVVLACEVRGTGSPPTGPLPEIRTRVGIDLAPPDLADPDAVLWLRALVWPDRPDRERRLLDAIDVARRTPADLRTGNAADLLPATLEGLPAGAVACVVHSSVWHQIPAQDRERIDAAIRVAAAKRPLLRVAGESTDGHVTELRVTGPGEGEARLFARAHPHGLWIDWTGT